MKKRTIIIIASIFIPILIIGGIIVGFKMNEQQTKDRQIAFLEAHEQEMTAYIQKLDPRVMEVEYDWNSVQKTTEENGLPQGGRKFLEIKIFEINKEKYFDNINDWLSVYTRDSTFVSSDSIKDFDISKEDLQYFLEKED
ncbi:hypothetical protein [Lactovum odontotermitis]